MFAAKQSLSLPHAGKLTLKQSGKKRKSAICKLFDFFAFNLCSLFVALYGKSRMAVFFSEGKSAGKNGSL